jgi:zinc D-Ala-D-Ala carboxypeptidase
MIDPISTHCSWHEAVDSATAEKEGIDNTPPDYIIPVMQTTANCVFEPIRAHFGVPLRISSFYRCPDLNKAVGGVPNSQHQFGQAIDIEMGWEMNLQIMEWARDNLDYDQILNEYPDANGNPSWVHISYVSPQKNRKQYLPIT